MKIKFKLFMIAIAIMLMGSCVSNDDYRTEYDTIRGYLRSRLDTDSINDVKRVFILAENGCIGCNKTLLNMALLEINSPESTIIIKNMGSIIDVSKFESDSIKNVIFDNSIPKIESDTLFSQSRFILLKHNKLDTILTINAQTLYQDMEYILHSRPSKNTH